MYDNAILIHLRKEIAERVGRATRARDESISDFGRRAILTELIRLGFLERREIRTTRRLCSKWEIVKASDVPTLGMQILRLLRLSPASGSSIELQLLSDGSIRVGELK